MSLIPKKGTVYIVDDDEAVRDSLQWLLEGKDYNVRCYDSAETFLNRYDAREVACFIVESHQGRMRAENLYNADEITGCRFSFWLPIRGVSVQPQADSTKGDAGVSV